MFHVQKKRQDLQIQLLKLVMTFESYFSSQF